jgi:hypothetical protein
MGTVLKQAARVTLTRPFMDSQNVYHAAGDTILAAGEIVPVGATLVDDIFDDEEDEKQEVLPLKEGKK